MVILTPNEEINGDRQKTKETILDTIVKDDSGCAKYSANNTVFYKVHHWSKTINGFYAQITSKC